MYGVNTLHDIKHDLDGMPHEVLDDLKQLAEDAAPALRGVVGDAGARGAAVGRTVAEHARNRVAEHRGSSTPMPSPGLVRRHPWLCALGVAGAVGAAAAAYRKMEDSRSHPTPRHAPASPRPGTTPPHGDPFDLVEDH
jgi:ElaB/YqjD/DUF883 family membrane-anchored ribosome-binding protein